MLRENVYAPFRIEVAFLGCQPLGEVIGQMQCESLYGLGYQEYLVFFQSKVFYYIVFNFKNS